MKLSKVFFNIVIYIIIVLRIPSLFRIFFQRDRVTVLYYHDIEKKHFERHIKYLKRHYHIIDLKTFYDYLYDDFYQIKGYPLLITFDDGHIGNYKLLNSFKNHKLRPVIFLTTDIVNTLTPFWFNLPFHDISEKEKLKKISDVARRIYLEKEFAKTPKILIPQVITTAMIKEMIPFVDFQSHTVDHPCLSMCSEEEAEIQISKSKSAIEEITKKPVFAIAYPNGDFTIRDINICRKFEYKIGFATTNGFVSKKSDPFSINRLSINDTKNYYEFILRATGMWFIIKRIMPIKDGRIRL